MASGRPCSRKRRTELGLDALRADVEQPVAAEQVPAEVVDDGERIAVEAVAHQELPLEVDGPDLIRCGGVERGGTRMLPTPATCVGTRTGHGA